MTAYDVVVVGGGVQGLWIAREAVRAGMRVAIVEARQCGAGASGGLLGALMPHMPVGWSEKKQFQFEALVELESAAAELYDETGIDPGYSRCGRVMPVRTERFLAQFEARQAASRERWRGVQGNKYELALLGSQTHEDWLDPTVAERGVFWDPLAARIEPVRYIEALQASVAPHCDLFAGWCFQSFDPATGRVKGRSAAGNQEIRSAAIVLAAGYETFDLVQQAFGLGLGQGVKGQAALLEAQLPANRPIIYDDGMYIVAHSDRYCAVGSTTEPGWEDAASTDERIGHRIKQSQALCPPLRNARVVRTWAGIRPKSNARDPIVGQLVPGEPIYIATGGFKITFGIAHRIAARLIAAMAAGKPVSGLPQTFDPAVHLAAAKAAASDH